MSYSSKHPFASEIRALEAAIQWLQREEGEEAAHVVWNVLCDLTNHNWQQGEKLSLYKVRK